MSVYLYRTKSTDTTVLTLAAHFPVQLYTSYGERFSPVRLR